MALGRGDGQAAYDALSESYGLSLEIGRLEGIIYVGIDLGRLLAMAGHVDDALTILERSAAGLARLGRMEHAAAVRAMIESLRASRP